ncbi:hypothetical protein LOAG_17964 [Loa loa]|uniref:Uncharacterized protein n=1 Tax=Loa loa TaxID=7209 RepID=A0A1S0UH35_LOALO|nr:hypothetical protein LOAG_17964 [Loa loa]EJD74771.1 hypothetical protein LOAG_17964 [Loa loa]
MTATGKTIHNNAKVLSNLLGPGRHIKRADSPKKHGPTTSKRKETKHKRDQ